MKQTHWKINGSAGEPIHGSTQTPDGEVTGVVLIGHGFKGYKDYGMFPWLASQFASSGQLVHRFNYSHSGMLDGDGDFERPDLFERDTWNRQVEDLTFLITALHDAALPLTILGHSRGGVACLLAVGRGAIKVDRIISLSAPATCNPLTEEMQIELSTTGFLESPSSRTNQMLRIGQCFLQEQLDNPASHDLLPLVEKIDVPLLVIHGEKDSTVPIKAAEAIVAAALHGTIAKIHGGDHVFNTPNPFVVDTTPSAQLACVWSTIQAWFANH